MVGIPKVLGGRYEVGEPIGRGGMAEVYIGRDNRLSRRVAIKVLRADLASDTTFQRRFRREAQSSAALNHPAIVGVFDTNEETIETERGPVSVPYIIMEYIEGHTVRSLLSPDSPVPIDEAIEITIGVLDALEYSHRQGIVHRDIKPGNVMITQTGTVKVMDFGIARAMADSAATMTQAHAVVGTAQYLSPEQARGEVVDARSDIYSTGCLLYELLTGRPPFVGDNPASVAYQHVNEAPRRPSELAGDIPQDLDTVVLHALAKNREQRYTDAAAMRSDLQVVLSQIRSGELSGPQTAATSRLAPIPVAAPTAIAAAPPPPPPPAATDPYVTAVSQPVRDEDEDDDERKPWWPWALLVALLVIGAAVAIFMINRSGGDPEPTPTETETVAMTVVPQLAGMDETGVRSALKNAKLEMKVTEPKASEEVEEGKFLSSNPDPGSDVEEGSVVEVTFSSGPDAVEIPDLAGRSQEEARRILEEMGLVAGSTTSEDKPGFQSGEVISTNPTAGGQIKVGERVDLVVATGNVELPDLRGKTQEEAESILTELNLNFSSTTVQTDEYAEGTVANQSRTPGLVQQRSVIKLEIAVPVPAPPTHSERPSETDEPSDAGSESPSPGDEKSSNDN